MKFVLTESKLETFFDFYLKKNHPHLFNLYRENMYIDDNRTIINGYEFVEPQDHIVLYFTYFLKDFSKYKYFKDDEDLENFPILVPSVKLMKELRGMFGVKSFDLLKNWFEKTYKLPVNTIKRRDENFII